MLRIITFLVGFGLAIIGFIYIIAYLNYLTVGYSFIDYLWFIINKPECLLAILGIILIMISIFKKGNNYDLCI